MSKAKAICDRVYAVGGPSLSGPEDCCIYLVDAGSMLVLIDSGVGYSLDRMEKNIRSLGFEPAQIWYIVATHCHIDHIGGLASIKERYGSKVIAHQLDSDGIEGRNNELTAASMYGVDYRPVKIDTLLKADAGMRQSPGVKVASGSMTFIRERKTFASTEGSSVEQEIVESGCGLTATAVSDGEVQVRSYPNAFGRHHPVEILGRSLPPHQDDVIAFTTQLLS